MSEIDRLSPIIEDFKSKRLFGGIKWGDRDRINRAVTVDIPAAVAKDTKFENARQNSDSGERPRRVRQGDGAGGAGDGAGQHQLFKLLADNPDFRRWLVDTAFRLAYEATGQRSTGAETSRG